MGLLDEAIREHLELKRRRGADPTEIARAEREALEPVFPGEQPRAVEPDLGEGEPTMPVVHGAVAPEDAGHADELPVAAPADEAGPSHEPAPLHEAAELHEEIRAVDPGFSTLGQETAELDMEAYMAAPDATAGKGPAAADAPGVIGDELLAWEEPHAPAPEGPPEQIPGQERLSLE